MLGCHAPAGGRARFAPPASAVSLRRPAPPGRRPLVVCAKDDKKEGKKKKKGSDSAGVDGNAQAPTAAAAAEPSAPKSDNGKGGKAKDTTESASAKASYDPKRWCAACLRWMSGHDLTTLVPALARATLTRHVSARAACTCI
jgi:hypothetical protein